MALRDVLQDEDDFSQNLGLDSIRALLGDEGAVRLLEKIGGTRVFVPVRVKSQDDGKPSKILQFMPYESAVKLSREFGGLAYDVPVGRKFRISHYRAQGLALNDIAKKVGVSRTTVVRILKRLRLETQRPMKKAA